MTESESVIWEKRKGIGKELVYCKQGTDVLQNGSVPSKSRTGKYLSH